MVASKATVTVNSSFNWGGFRVVDATIAFSAIYKTGGDSFTPAQFGLSGFSLPGLMALQGGSINGTKTWRVDIANGLILLYLTAGNEAGNNSNQSAVSFRCLAFGIG